VAPFGFDACTIGVKEIEMLIKKLELDKEILADQGSEADN
jgi:hypothetical protein